LLNILRDLMGDYALNVSMDTLMAKKSDSRISNDIARLQSTRMVTAAETVPSLFYHSQAPSFIPFF
jgi:phage/plasmid-associated DNA primase